MSMEGFQKPFGGKVRPRDVAMPVIRHGKPGTDEQDTIACSCRAWMFRHPRRKVRENRAQTHLKRKHKGNGLWL